MIQPKPFKLRCSKCGYKKIIRPKSDVLNPVNLLSVCPKCNDMMTKEELNFLDKLSLLASFK